jgi:hypothetical protein
LWGFVCGTGFCSGEVVVDLSTFIGETASARGVLGKDRRRYRRFLCEGFAEVLVIYPECLFRGEIRDISEHGCFVMTKARVRFELFAEAEIRFKLRNCQFKTHARVRNVRPGEGVGFEFTFENAQTEEQIIGLIQELTVLAPIKDA